MIIGIDGNEANVKKRVGIGEYAFKLLEQFKESRIPVLPAGRSNLKFQIYLKTEPLPHMPEESDNWQYRVIKPGKLWTQWRLPLDLFLHNPRPDVFFSPSHYAPRVSPVPTVISVMDLAYISFPALFNKSDLYQLKSWTAYSVKNAKKILTISKSSKNDIIKAYNVGSDRVVVTYPGIKETSTLTPRVYAMNQLKTKYNLSDNFILFVGTLQPRKNIKRLIEAFEKVLKSPDLKPKMRDTLQLVIVGKKGWQYEEILDAPNVYGITDRVLFLEEVNDQELSIFYKNALCFVLPSLYEGFGLPVVEAMKGGCPVITSNVSSMPEAGGDACLYVDPEDAEDIASKVVTLVTHEKLREELIKKGKTQASKFSWENTAKETLKVLEEVGGKT